MTNHLDEEEIQRTADPLGWARERLWDFRPQVRGDSRVAYCAEYLEAAAILFEKEPVEFRGLVKWLKGCGIHLTDFERKTKEKARELKEASKAREKAAAAATAKAGRPLQGRALDVADTVPWDQPVNLKDLLDAIVGLYNRFLALPLFADIALALWVIHTHALGVCPRNSHFDVGRKGTSVVHNVIMFYGQELPSVPSGSRVSTSSESA